MSSSQEGIYQELVKLDKGAAKCYKGALSVLKTYENPDRFPQAAHSLRELTNLISRKVDLPLELKESKDTLKKKLEKELIEEPELLPSPSEKEARILIGKWNELHSYFTAVSHHGKEAEEAEFFSKLSEFEAVLFSFIKPVPVTFKELDELLNAQSPKEEDIDKLSELLKHPTHVRYFFNKLSSSEWLDPLKDKGFFLKSPRGIREGNYIKFPAWPLSEYLAKVAEKRPREVMDLIIHARETDNFRVWSDYIDCALRMPSHIAKEIVPLAIKWTRTPFQTFIPSKVGELCIKLSDEIEANSSMLLLEAVLDVTIAEDTDELIGKKAKPYFDSWEYGNILEKVVPTILNQEPLKVIEVLCNKLVKAIKLEKPKLDAPGDLSYIWRPAIENSHEKRHKGDVKGLLVNAIRDGFQTLGKENEEMFKKAYFILSRYDLFISRRIELYLMRLFPGLLKIEILKALSGKPIFEDINLWHEYYHLLREYYASLPGDLKENILKWIDEGPDLDKFEAWYMKEKGRLPTEEEKVARKAGWQIRYLSAIKDAIPKDWKDRWNRIKTTYGEPEHPDFHFYVSPARWGSRSPLEKDEIIKMSVMELINYCRSWKPPKDFFAPSREGLSSQLRNLVSDNPSEFARLCHQFITLHPVYIFHLIDGLREAIKKGNIFEWDPFLLFCIEFLTAAERSKIPDDEDKDYDLRCIKRAIADFLRDALASDHFSPPIESRETIFKIIDELLLDDEPDPAYEERSTDQDWFTYSLNTVRGIAAHALIEYAFWCNRRLALSNKEDKMVPEVRQQLEKLLNPKYEPTRTIRAVIGERLPALFYLNKCWAIKHLLDIFPEEAKYRSLWEASWEAYVTFANLYTDVYKAMRSQYEKGINKLASPKKSHDAKEGMSRHLMQAYLYSLEDLGDDSLIMRFFKYAEPKTRGYAIWVIGTHLGQLKGNDISDKDKETVVERAVRFWEWRITEANCASAQEKISFIEELTYFGIWFNSGFFNEDWAIAQLINTLELSEGKTEFSSAVIDSLMGYVQKNYLSVLKVLALLVKADNESWLIVASKEKINILLKRIIREHPPEEIKHGLNELINSLTKKGLHEFADFFIK